MQNEAGRPVSRISTPKTRSSRTSCTSCPPSGKSRQTSSSSRPRASPRKKSDKVRPYASQVLLRENIGLDFAMWRHGLEHCDLGDTDELILTNSSLFGPMFPLAPILERMGEAPCDFWGMTDNFEYRWHLQSYFLVLKRAVLVSPSWARFWGGVLALRDKEQVILSYEVGFTSFLVESGFVPGALAPIQSWAPWLVRRRMGLERRWNTTLFHPEKLLAMGMPFVKATLLRDNPGHVDLAPVYDAMRGAGYDLDLVEFDRPPSPTVPRLRASARRLRALLAALHEDPTTPLAESKSRVGVAPAR